MRLWKLVCLSSSLGAVAAMAVGLASPAAEVVANPQPIDLYLLQKQFSHEEPKYDALARADPEVMRADEFHRADATDKAIARYRARAASLSDVKRITVNMNGTLPEYNADFKEFDFDLSNSTYIPIPTTLFGEFRISFVNGNEAQVWSIPPTEAEAALKRNNGARFIHLALTLEMTDSPPAVPEMPRILNTKIVGYDIVAGFGGARLGHVDVH